MNTMKLRKILFIGLMAVMAGGAGIGVYAASDANDDKNDLEYEAFDTLSLEGIKSLLKLKDEDSSIKSPYIFYYPSAIKFPSKLEKEIYREIKDLYKTERQTERIYAIAHSERKGTAFAFTLISLEHRNFTLEAVGAGDSAIDALAIPSGDDEWKVGFSGHENYNDIVDQISDEFLHPRAKKIMKGEFENSKEDEGLLGFTLIPKAHAETEQKYLFPWSKGDEWKWWDRGGGVHVWHGLHEPVMVDGKEKSLCEMYQRDPENYSKPETCAIDFGADYETDKSVIAPISGNIIIGCTGTDSQNVKITDDNGQVTKYFHIKKGTITTTVTDGVIERGERIGLVYTGPLEDACGEAWNNAAGHVHVIIPVNDFTFDNWKFTYPSITAEYTDGTTKNVGSEFKSTNLVAIDPCTPPPAGNWVVQDICVVSNNQTVDEDLIVKGGGVLTVNNGAILNVGMVNHQIYVYKNGKITVRADSKIT